MKHALVLTLLLAGCPSAIDSETLTADCCAPSDGGACEWQPILYTVPAVTRAWASDERGCKTAGLEPWHQ